MAREVETIEAAQWLAAQGLRKNVVISMFPNVKKFIVNYGSESRFKFENGLNWLRTDGYLGDRVYRLHIELFGSKAISSVTTGVNFAILCQSYFSKYPQDEMNCNRIYFLLQDILVGNALVIDSCKCCGKPYVLHRDSKYTNICNICKELNEHNAHEEN